MDQDIRNNITEKKIWTRALYMLLFAVCYSIAEIILIAIIVFQFLLSLLTRQPNDRLLRLGQSLSTYVYQIMLFMTFNTEYMPYPLGAWPKGYPTAHKEKKTERLDTQTDELP